MVGCPPAMPGSGEVACRRPHPSNGRPFYTRFVGLPAVEFDAAANLLGGSGPLRWAASDCASTPIDQNRTDLMDTQVRTPQLVFMQPQRLIVPLFQRPYVWNQENQWAPLWSDVSRLAERLLKTPKGPRKNYLSTSGGRERCGAALTDVGEDRVVPSQALRARARTT